MRIGYFSGFTYPAKGILFLFNNAKLWKFFLIPLVINIGLTFVIYFYFFSSIPEMATSISASLENWLLGPEDADTSFWVKAIFGGIRFIISAFMYYLIIIIYPLFIAVCSTLITPLFRTYLFDATMHIHEGVTPASIPFADSLKYALKSIGTTLRISIMYLLLTIVISFLNFVPGLGIVLQFILTAYYIGWEFILPYFEEKQMLYSEQSKFCRKNFRAIFGFGTLAYILILIPLLSGIFLTTHTIGGGLLISDLKKDLAE
ncbi:MAG: EI24 domain-containing protein [Leptospirales bacterium]